CSSLEPHLW
nr:immunoglobulin heavy chain junction region [Homo sapiens]